MKRILCFILAIALTVSFAGCGKKTEVENADVEAAKKLLAEKWQTVYDESPFNVDNDRHLEVKHTRIVNIKETDIEALENVDYLIDFILFSNYSGTAPYYNSVDLYDTVTVYKDGTMDCDIDVFSTYIGTYGIDFTGLIESIEDYGDQFNGEIKVK